jgi:UDP-N-acetylmuramate dehydrogenase
MSDQRAQLQLKVPGILVDEPLAPYSTFQIGGPADLFYKLANINDLPILVQLAKEYEVPYFLFGSGSNLLFSDEGFRGLVIKIEAKNIEFLPDNKIKADAGVIVAKLISESVNEGYSGLESWTGLPGTIGAAVRGNAGCNGLETTNVLVEAEIFNPETGEIRTQPHDYFQFDYRHSRLKDSKEIVLNATFQLQKSTSSKEEQQKIIQECNKKRIGSQPFGATTGSFFKNPDAGNPKMAAGYLLEQAGLKGHKIGNAQISEKHANFFLNLGGASAQDVVELARHAKQQVKAKFDVELQEEVQLLGEKGSQSLADF